MDRNKELKVHRLRLPGRSLCSIRSNRKWCKRRGSSLQCQNCFFVYPIIDCNLKNLFLNFVFKLYHKTCEHFYRNFGLYEKSPNSFLPGLPRSIINQFRFHNLLCLCLASVHLPHPFHLVFGFQLLGHAVLLCQ